MRSAVGDWQKTADGTKQHMALDANLQVLLLPVGCQSLNTEIKAKPSFSGISAVSSIAEVEPK